LINFSQQPSPRWWYIYKIAKRPSSSSCQFFKVRQGNWPHLCACVVRHNNKLRSRRKETFQIIVITAKGKTNQTQFSRPDIFPSLPLMVFVLQCYLSPDVSHCWVHIMDFSTVQLFFISLCRSRGISSRCTLYKVTAFLCCRRRRSPAIEPNKRNDYSCTVWNVKLFQFLFVHKGMFCLVFCGRGWHQRKGGLMELHEAHFVADCVYIGIIKNIYPHDAAWAAIQFNASSFWF
jgi:hypothetical protein